MKIVVLDGYTLNPGDLSWEGLSEHGEVTVHERTPDEQIIERASAAEAIFTNKTIIKRETLEALPDLKYIGVLATGYNVVDTEAAKGRGVLVTNIPAYSTKSVSQMVFAHVLNFASGVAQHAQTVREGRWSSCHDFCYWDSPLAELSGLTIGIIGYGRIGRATADLARAFGMQVLVCGRSPIRDVPEGVTGSSLDSLIKNSDFISLHCPLTRENTQMVSTAFMEKMKPTAYLINTSRGPLINEAALAAALESGEIAGAGLDVLGQEPPDADNPLFKLENCIITPHISWATKSARSRLMDTAVENLQAFLDGNPQNVVNF